MHDITIKPGCECRDIDFATREKRYWYTLISDRGVWLSGWAFGDTPEIAGAYVMERESKYHPVIVTEQLPLSIHLQSVPGYNSTEDTVYTSLVVKAGKP